VPHNSGADNPLVIRSEARNLLFACAETNLTWIRVDSRPFAANFSDQRSSARIRDSVTGFASETLDFRSQFRDFLFELRHFALQPKQTVVIG
jgi:hypothetical protein